MKKYAIGKEDTLELLRTGKMKVMDENGDYFQIEEEVTKKQRKEKVVERR